MHDSTKPLSYTPLKFRDLLFGCMEARREIADTFKVEDIYFFICDCHTAYTARGTQKAEEALAEIAENGTFRLVADSHSEFLAMLRDGRGIERHESNRSTAQQTNRTPNYPKPGA